MQTKFGIFCNSWCRACFSV